MVLSSLIKVIAIIFSLTEPLSHLIIFVHSILKISHFKKPSLKQSVLDLPISSINQLRLTLQKLVSLEIYIQPIAQPAIMKPIRKTITLQKRVFLAKKPTLVLIPPQKLNIQIRMVIKLLKLTPLAMILIVVM